MTDHGAAPEWVTEAFASRLERLAGGAVDAPVFGIAGEASKATISAQFTDNAGEYHARYAAQTHFEELFRQALDLTSLTVTPSLQILDLGSGSGVNSVIPCLRIFPESRIVATDLSPELLTMLSSSLPGLQAQDRVVCVVMDAMADHIRRRSFDMVTGAAILHHLLNPEQGVQAAARALKSGGKAVFFEPFDGYGVLALAYRRILAESERRFRKLDTRITAALEAVETDIAARTSPDRHSEAFSAMDDKWLFAQEQITSMARECGFAKIEIIAHQGHAHLYRDMAQIHVRLQTGRTDLHLPDWALGILDDFDRSLTSFVKSRVMLEGTIVLTKAG